MLLLFTGCSPLLGVVAQNQAQAYPDFRTNDHGDRLSSANNLNTCVQHNLTYHFSARVLIHDIVTKSMPIVAFNTQLPSQSKRLTPYSIFAYTLVILCASAKLNKCVFSEINSTNEI